LYKGLPAARPRRWRWLTVSALVVIAGSVIAVPVLALAYAGHAAPSNGYGGGGRPFGGPSWVIDRYLIVSIGVAFVVGGLLGFALARSWWSTLALYVVGLALWLGLMQFSAFGDEYRQSAGDMFGWLFWIFGVSAGVGVRDLMRRRRVVRASYLTRPG
jgi:hypothetical protein